MQKRIEKQNQTHRFGNEKGLTLIDMAIALIVIGLLITPALYALKLFRITEASNISQTNLGLVEQAIEEYHITNDFYPCPADPTLARANPNYGVPVTTGAAINCQFQVGAVPFEEIGLDVEAIFDGYGYKINYAVDRSMGGSIAVPPPAAPAIGNLTVESIPLILRPGDCVSICAEAITPFPGGALNACTPDPIDTYPANPIVATPNIQYTLFSSGSDGVGAFSESGAQISACTNGGTFDGENCDGDRTFRADVNDCMLAETNNARRFDDINISGALEKNEEPSNMFETSTINPDGIGTTVNYTGINNDDPQHELDVIGNVRVSDDDMIIGDGKQAAAHASDYCDPTGTVCFESELIGGKDPKMQCGSLGMAGIAFNSAICRNRIDGSTSAAATCTATARKVTSLTVGGAYECAE